MDYTFIAFVASAVLALASALLVFVFRDILHTVLALTALFMFNSALFLLLGQPLLAVVQLFILVGGISTFLFVGVASAELMEFKFNRLVALVLLWAFVFAVIAYPLYGKGYSLQETSNNIFGASDIASSLLQYNAVFYVMLVTLFAVSLGAVVALKRMRK